MIHPFQKMYVPLSILRHKEYMKDETDYTFSLK